MSSIYLGAALHFTIQEPAGIKRNNIEYSFVFSFLKKYGYFCIYFLAFFLFLSYNNIKPSVQ
jgi:hypothetical protein